ncbi:peroxisomal membrane protein PEX16-like [Portunus trituberculatus]|uniref:peroxisomal membrane protein PEX16-like n=1 Tax=Portunus trituberculatus TaxID=210409 RepID=UPI001E1CD73F|nr:peroxisomal membrane protein PEX16-like [Portunus trituberculatus]
MSGTMVAWQETAGQRWLVKYKEWVIANPQGAAEVEAVIKWGSYILAGRLQNSSLVCEVVYAGSRLFEMFNDFLIRGSMASLTPPSPQVCGRLKVMLSALECVEVLVEVSAGQLWGEMGRWAVVAAIQLLKCIGRFLLLVREKSALVVPSPPIKPLDRRSATRARQRAMAPPTGPVCSEVVRLPRSGRVIRTLAAAPPIHQRTFSPPQPPHTTTITTTQQGTKPRQPVYLLAESLHTLRPLCHLMGLYLCGMDSWAPWALALALDYTSLTLHNQAPLTDKERNELVRRRLSLLFYLLRSPAYQRITRRRLNGCLSTLARRIPLLRSLLHPLMEYIPHWQRIYAYTWS